MKRLTKYIARLILGIAVSFVLALLNTELTLPMNIASAACCTFLGLPGIALAVAVNFIL